MGPGDGVGLVARSAGDGRAGAVAATPVPVGGPASRLPTAAEVVEAGRSDGDGLAPSGPVDGSGAAAPLTVPAGAGPGATVCPPPVGAVDGAGPTATVGRAPAAPVLVTLVPHAPEVTAARLMTARSQICCGRSTRTRAV